MPFFCTRHTQICDFSLNVKRTAALQVRIPMKMNPDRKRVFLSASASMTVEAALVLPLMLFAGVLLMMPFRILDVERQMQAVVVSVAEEISQTAYLLPEEGGWAGSAAAFAYAEGAVRAGSGGLPVHRLSLAGSSLLEDGETVDLTVSYQMKLPFSVFGLGNVKRRCRSWLRAWVGDTGAGAAGEEEGVEEDPIVYVGKDSTRYHNSAFCHYLYNRLSAVPAGRIGDYRNESGQRYTACGRCGGLPGGTVYIMPYGEHYHNSRSCSAITAYVRPVRRSEVEHLGPCTYCSGGGTSTAERMVWRERTGIRRIPDGGMEW